ncbi:MAG: hypothetical protein GY776_12355 [Alteromonas sp.]|nr:hypothetical protein [Alteromonas sp.]
MLKAKSELFVNKFCLQLLHYKVEQAGKIVCFFLLRSLLAVLVDFPVPRIMSSARKLKTSLSIPFYFSASTSRWRFHELCIIASVVKAHEEKRRYASGPNNIEVTQSNIYVTSQRSRSQFKRGAYGWLQEEEAAPQLASR